MSVGHKRWLIIEKTKFGEVTGWSCASVADVDADDDDVDNVDDAEVKVELEGVLN